MRTLATMIRVEAALLLREPSRAVLRPRSAAHPVGLNGSGGNVGQPQFGGVGVVDVMVPRLILLVVCTSGLMALPETLANYRERGFLRRLRISPLRPWQILGSHAATQLVVAVAGLILLVSVGWPPST